MHNLPTSADDYFSQWFAKYEVDNSFPKSEYLKQVPLEFRKEVSSRIDSVINISNSLLKSFSCLTEGGRIGEFELISEIKTGPNATVWKAHQLSVDRIVALKTLPPLTMLSLDGPERFKQEAKLAAAKKHPNIVQVYDAGKSGGILWIAQEFIGEGKSLADEINEKNEQRLVQGQKHFSLIGSQFRSICSALEQVHAEGIIHRDVKPGNILLNEKNEVFLSDFGMAQEEGDITFMEEGGGTPAYNSPEQISQPSKDVGAPSDIFSLGVSLYEILVGVRPFWGDTPEQVRRNICSTEPIPPRRFKSQIPKELEVLCLSCLQKNKHLRPSAQFLKEELNRWLSGNAILTSPPNAIKRLQLWVIRRPWKAAATFVGAFSLLVFAVLFSENRRSLDVTERALLQVVNFSQLWNPTAYSRLSTSEITNALDHAYGLILADSAIKDPKLRVQVLFGLGVGYLAVERPFQARDVLRKANNIIEGGDEFAAAIKLDSRLYYAWALGKTGESKVALPILRQLIDNPGVDAGAELRGLWATNRLCQTLLQLHSNANTDEKIEDMGFVYSTLEKLEQELKTQNLNTGNAIYPSTILLLGLWHYQSRDNEAKARLYLEWANEIFAQEFGVYYPERRHVLEMLSYLDSERGHQHMRQFVELTFFRFDSQSQELINALWAAVRLSNLWRRDDDLEDYLNKLDACLADTQPEQYAQAKKEAKEYRFQLTARKE